MRSAGAIQYRHQYLDMSSQVVEASNWTRAGRTCSASMGFSFAAGTTDGVRQSPLPLVSQLLFMVVKFALLLWQAHN